MRPIDADAFHITMYYGGRKFMPHPATEAIVKAVEDAIRNMPTLEWMPTWIPVTERLPERDDEYIVTVTDGNDKWTSAAEYYSKLEQPWISIGTVIAWVEFPKPYEAKNDD